MKCVSKDGTTIAFEQAGGGPPVILIPGALCDRATGPNKPLAKRLAEAFTVIVYDRRGRGASGDTRPYRVDREVEDIEALIDAAGGSAQLYGISSGGALALDAAARLPGKVTRVAVYEVPLVVDDSRLPVSDASLARIDELLSADRRGAAVKLFMRHMVQVPAVLVAATPLFPGWSKNKAHAHTLAYDLELMRDTQRGAPISRKRWSSVTMPALVASGGKSPDWVRHAGRDLADALPNARHETLAGQRHYVKADALAPVLTEFFTAAAPPAANGRGGDRGQRAVHAQPRPGSSASSTRP
jgi:pimeloyl-ACP methyl ester carboxylesterase